MTTEFADLFKPKPYTEDEQPWQRLAAAIIEQAVYDYKHLVKTGGIGRLLERRQSLWRRKATRASKEKLQLRDAESVLSFFRSSHFEDLCGFIRVNPDGIRDRIGFTRSCPKSAAAIRATARNTARA